MNSRLSIVVTLAAAVTFIGSAAEAATIAYWQFDENGTNAIDAVGTSQTLTRQGGAQSALVAVDPIPLPDAGPFTTGTMADNPFSVFNPRLITETSTPFRMTSTSFTLEGWFQTSSATAQFIAGDRMPGSTIGANTAFTGWHVQLNTTGSIEFRTQTTGGSSATITTGTGLNDGSFHHFAAVWDAPNNQLLFYVDGDLEISGSGLGTGGITYAAGANQFAVGGRHTGSNTTVLDNNLFMGRLDEFRFSNVALTSDQFLFQVPEPASLGLMVIALGLLASGRRRKR